MNQGQPPTSAGPQRTDAASTTPLLRVLVVDDTEDNLFLMTGLLEDKYELLLASSGKELWPSSCRRHSPT